VSSDLGSLKVGLSESGTKNYYLQFVDSHNATGESAEYLFANSTIIFSDCTGLGEGCAPTGWNTIKMIKKPSSTLQYLKNSVSRYNSTPTNYADNEVTIAFD
jgi:hypothetical protein